MNTYNKPKYLLTHNNKKVYAIPDLKNYGITADGDLYSFKINRFKKWQLSKSTKENAKNQTHGYYVCGVVNDKTQYVGISRHRLLLKVFRPVPNMDKLYVNHINGIPGDDRIDNLEWVTPKDNLIHALKNGLMPNSVIKIDVLDTSTGIIRNFNSIVEAALFLGWSYNKVYHRLNKESRYSDGILFKRNSDKWFDTDKPITYMGIRKKIVSVGETIQTHATIMDASKNTGVNTTSISTAAKENTGKPVKGIKFYFEENFHLDSPIT